MLAWEPLLIESCVVLPFTDIPFDRLATMMPLLDDSIVGLFMPACWVVLGAVPLEAGGTDVELGDLSIEDTM